LVFDILTPVIVSLLVLLFQPIAVIGRNVVLKNATKKMASLPNIIVIGITGSYGKTTTKEFLTTILSSKFNVLSTKEHKNSEMGIASTILNDLKPENQIFIVEMGAYKKGGIKLLCDMVKPRLGIVTGVTVQHLSLFGSMENLLSAEGGYELAKALPSNGTLFLNAENKYCLDLYKKLNTYGKINKKLYAENGNKLNVEIWAEDVETSSTNLSFVSLTRDKQMAHFKLNVLGKHNLQNILGAILIAKELGMSLEEISKACQNIKPPQAGTIVKKGVHGINVIDSSYSSNPDGAVADLDCLRLFSGKRLVIMPCLIELGEKSKEIHYKIGQKIAEVCDLAIVTTKDKFEDIKKGAQSNCEVVFLEDPQEIFNKITTFFKEGDTVLLEGRVPEKLLKLLKL
jgi:UDP-N-acetylmuramoyl-tripeptide--D-alanyl-D-alanine ligase